MNINFKLNGKEVTIESRPDRRLSSILRDNLNLKGVRKRCSNGQCGSCLILLNERLVSSCIIPAFAVRHQEVTTIEGLTQSKEFNDILKGFKDSGVHLCSYCAPARVISTVYMLRKHIMPKEEQIMDYISSVQCRCTSFSQLKRGMNQASINFNKRHNNG